MRTRTQTQQISISSALNRCLFSPPQLLQALKRRVNGKPITVLTHSAGGWLGRVYLLDFGSEVRGGEGKCVCFVFRY